MKLCFIYHTFFRYGGIQRVIAQLVNNLCTDIQIDLICTEAIDLNNNPYDINLSKIKVYYFPFERDLQTKTIQILNRKLLHGRGIRLQHYLSKIYYSKKTQQRWISFLNKHHYDLMIGCSMTFNTLLGKLKPSVNGQLWGWEHNEYDSYFGKDSYERYQKNIYGELISNLNGVIVLTRSDAQKYKVEFNLTTIVLPNPLSFSPLKHLDYNNKAIIAVGRLDANKQFDILIRIFKSFLQDYSDWSLKIIGEGIEKDSLMKQIINEHLESSVELLPYTNDIQKYYKEASIYVCTSKYESFGLTVLEAMACGLPIITFNSSGPSNLVSHGINGYIVNKGDEGKFISYLCELAKNPSKRKGMGHSSIEESKNYQLNTIISRWKQLLDNIEQHIKNEVNEDACT